MARARSDSFSTQLCQRHCCARFAAHAAAEIKQLPGLAVGAPANVNRRSTSNYPRRFSMRVMVIVKANKDSEAGVLPGRELLEKMGKYNEQLVKAGVMLAGDGLQASSKGKRVKFDGDKRTVINGPFSNTKDLIAGFWLWKVNSMDDAVEWLKRAPFDGGEELEIRQVFEAADFGDQLTPELRQQEERLRAESQEAADRSRKSA